MDNAASLRVADKTRVCGGLNRRVYLSDTPRL